MESARLRNAGRVVTRQELVNEAWGTEYTDAVDSLKLIGLGLLSAVIVATPLIPSDAGSPRTGRSHSPASLQSFQCLVRN
mgnify:CR=1 FL=1